LVHAGARVLRLPEASDGHIGLTALLRLLGREQVTSILIEGGATVHGAFCRQQLVDELLLLYAPILVGDQGTPLVRGYSITDRATAPAPSRFSVRQLGDDFLFRALYSR
jgi:diaminohydroxyphosphoribosylaminopyrimidine deaminase/5-amino-6-(5-phosphoribosylamino)uracil reductase